jgi:hypothetical protein
MFTTWVETFDNILVTVLLPLSSISAKEGFTLLEYIATIDIKPIFRSTLLEQRTKTATKS